MCKERQSALPPAQGTLDSSRQAWGITTLLSKKKKGWGSPVQTTVLRSVTPTRSHPRLIPKAHADNATFPNQMPAPGFAVFMHDVI